jgi:hypothetical protein
LLPTKVTKLVNRLTHSVNVLYLTPPSPLCQKSVPKNNKIETFFPRISVDKSLRVDSGACPDYDSVTSRAGGQRITA